MKREKKGGKGTLHVERTAVYFIRFAIICLLRSRSFFRIEGKKEKGGEVGREKKVSIIRPFWPVYHPDRSTL